jgi:hypothetical protein
MQANLAYKDYDSFWEEHEALLAAKSAIFCQLLETVYKYTQ